MLSVFRFCSRTMTVAGPFGRFSVASSVVGFSVSLCSVSLCPSTASSWGKPQGKAFRDGFLHEALDEMPTPATKKSDMMQSSGK